MLQLVRVEASNVLAQVPPSHGMRHALAVEKHVENAINELQTTLTPDKLPSAKYHCGII